MDDNCKKKERVFFWIGVFCIVGSLFMVSESIEATIGYGITSIIFLILGRRAIPYYIFKLTTPKEKKSREAKSKNAIFKFPIVSGLNVPENTFCTIKLHKDFLDFRVNGVKFTLEHNKVTDISIKTDSEIQQQYVSSVGGAIAGATLFGSLGAMVGGRSKLKKAMVTSYFLIITYLKDENISYLAFNVSKPFMLNKAKKFIKIYKQSFNFNESKKVAFKL